MELVLIETDLSILSPTLSSLMGLKDSKKDSTENVKLNVKPNTLLMFLKETPEFLTTT